MIDIRLQSYVLSSATTLLACLLSACSTIDQGSTSPTSPSSLNITADPIATLATARQIFAADPFITLISVDQQGQPRARTVEHSVPDEHFVIYLSTIPGTRKLEQIAANPSVTLYADGPGDTSYVTVMGTATIIQDKSQIKQFAWRKPQARSEFWPDFPNDYVLIRIDPIWLEVLAPNIAARDNDWHPQAVTFPESEEPGLSR